MKKYAPYVLVFFTVLIIAILIDQNNQQQKPAQPDLSTGAKIVTGLAGVLISSLNADAKPAPTPTPILLEPVPNETESVPSGGNGSSGGNSPNDPINIPFNPTQPAPDPENLIRNGYFLMDYDGWERTLIDEGGSSKASIIESNNSPFNRALQINQTGAGEIYFAQTVPVNSINLSLSLTFESVISYYGYTSIYLNYYDSLRNHLGFTSLRTDDSWVSRKDSNTKHYIYFKSDRVNKDFAINIAQEVNENLLGIHQNDISFIEIVLDAGTTGNSHSSTLTVSDIVMKYVWQ